MTHTLTKGQIQVLNNLIRLASRDGKFSEDEVYAENDVITEELFRINIIKRLPKKPSDYQLYVLNLNNLDAESLSKLV